MAFIKTEDDMNLKKYFESKVQLEIPKNQRMYSWTQEQLEDYWDDLKKVLDKQVPFHYLGVISLIQDIDNSDVHQIVDGQQRLVTTAILISVMRDLAIYNGVDSTPEELHIEYLLNKQVENIDYKIKPSSIDLITFELVINMPHNRIRPYNIDSLNSDFRIANRTDNVFYNEKIFFAYSFFITKVSEYFIEMTNGQNEMKIAIKLGIFEILRALDKMKIILVKSDAKEHLFQFFESLNNKGLQLNKFDIIRNTLLEIASNKFPNDCDLIAKKWDDLYMTLERVDSLRFLKYYLMCLPDNKIIQIPQLHNEYEMIFHEIPTSNQYLFFLDEMIKYAKVFNQLFNGHFTVDGIDYERSIYFINEIGQQATHSFIMDYLINEDNTLYMNEILSRLENMMFRRAISGSSTKVLDGIFRSMIRNRFENGVYNKSQISDIINQYTPSDDEFFQAARYREWDNDSLSNYALREIEFYLMGDSAKENIKLKDRSSVHIEHIAPYNYTDEWMRSFNNMPKAEYRKKIKYIGNIVLLESKLNQSIKDKIYPDKKIAIQSTNSNFFQVNTLLSEYNNWDNQTIDQRSDQVITYFRNIWKK